MAILVPVASCLTSRGPWRSAGGVVDGRIGAGSELLQRVVGAHGVLQERVVTTRPARQRGHHVKGTDGECPVCPAGGWFTGRGWA